MLPSLVLAGSSILGLGSVLPSQSLVVLCLDLRSYQYSPICATKPRSAAKQERELRIRVRRAELLMESSNLFVFSLWAAIIVLNARPVSILDWNTVPSCIWPDTRISVVDFDLYDSMESAKNIAAVNSQTTAKII